MSTTFATSASQTDDGLQAGKAVAQETMSKLASKKPVLGVLFCSADYPYKEVLDGIRSVLGDLPLVGCSSAGGFTENIVIKQGIVFALVASDAHRFFTGIGYDIATDELKALKAASRDFPKTVPNFPNRSAMLFLDGLAGRGEETVLAASSLFDEQVKFVGGAAADNLLFKQTQVFCDKQSISNAVSVCYTASKTPLIVRVGHGHTALSPAMTITKAHGNVLYEVEGRPAADVWKEELTARAGNSAIPLGDLNDPVNFSRLLLKHEAGIVTRGGYKMRFPTSCNPDRSLNFVCTITEGAEIKIMDSDREGQIASARDTAHAAFDAAEGSKIAGAIIFDCACRGMILKNSFQDAVLAMKQALPNIPIIGCETYGEIAMEQGQLSGFHNATTVVVLIPD